MYSSSVHMYSSSMHLLAVWRAIYVYLILHISCAGIKNWS